MSLKNVYIREAAAESERIGERADRIRTDKTRKPERGDASLWRLLHVESSLQDEFAR